MSNFESVPHKSKNMLELEKSLIFLFAICSMIVNIIKDDVLCPVYECAFTSAVYYTIGVFTMGYVLPIGILIVWITLVTHKKCVSDKFIKTAVTGYMRVVWPMCCIVVIFTSLMSTDYFIYLYAEIGIAMGRIYTYLCVGVCVMGLYCSTVKAVDADLEKLLTSV